MHLPAVIVALVATGSAQVTPVTGTCSALQSMNCANVDWMDLPCGGRNTDGSNQPGCAISGRRDSYSCGSCYQLTYNKAAETNALCMNSLCPAYSAVINTRVGNEHDLLGSTDFRINTGFNVLCPAMCGNPLDPTIPSVCVSSATHCQPNNIVESSCVLNELQLSLTSLPLNCDTLFPEEPLLPRWAFWLIIALSIIVGILLLFLLFWCCCFRERTSKSKSKRSDTEMATRLAAIRAARNDGGQVQRTYTTQPVYHPPPQNRKEVMWAFTPSGAGSSSCPHGYSPPGSGYGEAVCPWCYPTVANQARIGFHPVRTQQYEPSMRRSSSFGMHPGRMRKPRNAGEMPEGAPPLPPPGYVTVPMVKEV